MYTECQTYLTSIEQKPSKHRGNYLDAFALKKGFVFFGEKHAALNLPAAHCEPSVTKKEGKYTQCTLPTLLQNG